MVIRVLFRGNFSDVLDAEFNVNRLLDKFPKVVDCESAILSVLSPQAKRASLFPAGLPESRCSLSVKSETRRSLL